MTETDPKTALRIAAKARRAALAPTQRRVMAEAVASRFVDGFGPMEGRIVAGYVAIRDELDPAPTLLRLAAGGARLALPVVTARDAALNFRIWHPDDPLIPGAFRIPEPGPECPEVVPSVVLVPLLAFDRSGHRLGWGAGHYDRTLAGLRVAGPVLAIGLAFSVQEVDRLPSTPEDQPLDAIVTEAERIDFRQEKAP